MTREDVAGLVLAGGLGRRMGGVDKGLQPFRGRTMVEWAIERFRPQVGTLMINANQHLDAYAAFGFPVVSDRIGGFAGPLAGLHAGLTATSLPYIATVPCDSPFLPPDLVERLSGSLVARDVDLAVARTGDQPHPVFTLCRRSVLGDLTAYLGGGGRKIDAWYARLRVAEVDFDDEAEAFANINTREELGAMETRNP